MRQVIVKTQSELDNLDFNEELEVLIQSKKEDNLVINATGKDWYVIIDNWAIVKVMYESSQVWVMRDSSQVWVMYGSSQVKVMYDSSQIWVMCDSSQVWVMYESSQVWVMRDSSQVREMCDSSQIWVMRDSSQVFLYWFAMVCMIFSWMVTVNNQNTVRFLKENKNNIKIIGNANLIELESMKPNLESFSKFYPTKTQENWKMLWYKSVHKQWEKYISNYNPKFEYKIWKTVKEKIDTSSNSCGYGIHISDKYWALSFGNGWDDLAILELEVDPKNIHISSDTDGKVRCSEAKVIREVPKEEFYK